jgi:hypothetical protein
MKLFSKLFQFLGLKKSHETINIDGFGVYRNGTPLTHHSNILKVTRRYPTLKSSTLYRFFKKDPKGAYIKGEYMVKKQVRTKIKVNK